MKREIPLLIVGITLVLPLTPLGKLFGFMPLPPLIITMIVVIVALYILSAEVMKKIFYKKIRSL